MRLLNSCSGEMKFFLSYTHIPPYAILSHTWGDEEVTYKDWKTLSWKEVRSKKGFQKIEYCCQQAASDGLEWVWIDTCCIDKASSAELTESINSMFRWYRNAAVCYAYLADVPKNLRLTTIEKKLAKSRWFTRGWTLQELIAPSEVIFYSYDWHQVGTKSELSACISGITGIDEMYLNGANLQSASVAQRMSWAARRQTSRVEDVAYSLLGIFDVNIPLIYGEGHKAFQRLQEEIMRAYPEDPSIFAWGTVVSRFSKYVRTEAEVLGEESLEWKAGDDDSLLGLLAQSPKDFEESGQFMCHWAARRFFRRWDFPLTAPTIVGSSMRLDLPICHAGPPFAICHGDSRLRKARLRRVKTAVLACGRPDGKWFQFIQIPLLICTGGFYARTRELVVSDVIALPQVNYDQLDNWRSQLVVERQPQYRPRTGDIVLRRMVSFMSCTESLNAETIDVAVDDGFIKALAPTQNILALLAFEYDSVAGLALTISRVGEDAEDGNGNLYFSVLPINLSAPANMYPGQEEGGRLQELGEDEKEQDKKSETDTGSVINVEDEAQDDEMQWDESPSLDEDDSEDSSETDEQQEDDSEEDDEQEKGKEENESDVKEESKPPTRTPTPMSSRPPFKTKREAYEYLWEHWQMAPYMREMALPTDTWEVPESPYIPKVRIVTERVYLDDDPEQPVDMVDILITSSWAGWSNGLWRPEHEQGNGRASEEGSTAGRRKQGKLVE
ncbi:heterokaryon incompatibility protein-domain-containing protein [Hypomontagnella monticulosa]|nr:heterokaryon incompatibility protein-domain-containing protein [Hypomontagnella monticulosa]